MRIAGRETAEADRREANGLVWEILTGDESNLMELRHVVETLAAVDMAYLWLVGGLQSVVGLPEPQCVASLSVAEKLGLDLSAEGLKARRVIASIVSF